MAVDEQVFRYVTPNSPTQAIQLGGEDCVAEGGVLTLNAEQNAELQKLLHPKAKRPDVSSAFRLIDEKAAMELIAARRAQARPVAHVGAVTAGGHPVGDALKLTQENAQLGHVGPGAQPALDVLNQAGENVALGKTAAAERQVEEVELMTDANNDTGKLPKEVQVEVDAQMQRTGGESGNKLSEHQPVQNTEHQLDGTETAAALGKGEGDRDPNSSVPQPNKSEIKLDPALENATANGAKTNFNPLDALKAKK